MDKRRFKGKGKQFTVCGEYLCYKKVEVEAVVHQRLNKMYYAYCTHVCIGEL